MMGAEEFAKDAPTIHSQWTPSTRIWRRLLMPVFCLPDRGLLGLKPLRTHILICGFPRSGTTLLQLMLENGLPQARRFGREIGGWRAATYQWRNHSLMISKVPQDVFRLDALRNFYRTREANLRILLLVRDPRDVLTSRRQAGGPPGYCVGADRWRRYYSAFLRERQKPDTLVIRYEDLIGHTASEQSRIEAFIGESMKVPFTCFHAIARPDFDTDPLNGLRPVDPTSISAWSAPQHRPRIEQLLRELPELSRALIDLGYESNHDCCGAVAARLKVVQPGVPQMVPADLRSDPG